MDVFEADEKIMKYLRKRQILTQYQKAKQYILEGDLQQVALKKRKPTSDNIYQFRITKKYRAYAKMEKVGLVVFSISDHQ